MKSSAKYEMKMLLQNRGVSDDVIKTILEHDYLFDHVIEDILDTIEGEFRIFADEHENVVLGSVEPVIAKGSGNLVFAGSRRVVLAGVDELIVVETENEVLISRRGNSQSVKDVVEILKTLDPEAL